MHLIFKKLYTAFLLLVLTSVAKGWVRHLQKQNKTKKITAVTPISRLR